MPLTEIAIAITTIKTAKDIIKSINSLSKDLAVKEKASELLNIIISIQSQLLNIQSQCDELLQSKRNLEQKIMNFENWQKTEDSYKLTEVAPSTYAYIPKESNQSAVPKHYLCANCFNKKRYILCKVI